jgi:DNA-binding NtrC family response regulator
VERRPAHCVLVVDDDASIRLLCRINLELDGWTVREAATIAEARSMLADGAVTVVLLDVHVGTDSGVEFADELQRDRPEIAIALLTGSASAPTLDEAAVDAVLAKPFELEELSQTVRSLARGRRIESPTS